MRYNKIYVLTPDHTEAGGIESIYQLVDAINQLGGNAINIFDNTEDNPIPERYRHYNIKYSGTFEDSKDNLFIVPEIWTPRLKQIINCKKAIWWLSVDHNYNQFHDFHDETILHFCQSFYSLSYLISKGNSSGIILSDYIFLDNTFEAQKENIVCYNPAKGKEYTTIIQKLNPDIHFLPLENLTNVDMKKALARSKVYIDFGNHPGRDRIPREAVILGNCIITNRQGSAKYYSDVPLDYEYKIEDLTKVGKIIRQCFDNYEEIINDFELYRNIISKQKEALYFQVKKFLVI